MVDNKMFSILFSKFILKIAFTKGNIQTIVKDGLAQSIEDMVDNLFST